MSFRNILLFCLLLAASRLSLSAQAGDSVYILTAIVYDEGYHPVPASHIVNMNSHQGSVTDSLGIFRIPVHPTDTLLLRNIAYHDTLVSARLLLLTKHITVKRKYYPLPEAKVFEWGSTYGDFKDALIGMPNQKSLGESMGFPVQDPDYIPFEMNEAYLKSPLFLLKSPVSYFYYNFNKEAKSARKVYWLNKNLDKQKWFDEILSLESVSSITGLSGDDLQAFRSYLYQEIKCNINCSELQIYTEIYILRDIYQGMHGIEE